MLVLTGSTVMSTGTQLVDTLTTTVKLLPTHVPLAGVTVYVAVPFPEEMDRVPLILVTPVGWAAPPVTPPVYVGKGHVYVVPPGTPAGVTEKVSPEFIEVL
jgi:hypothetical protein